MPDAIKNLGGTHVVAVGLGADGKYYPLPLAAGGGTLETGASGGGGGGVVTQGTIPWVVSQPGASSVDVNLNVTADVDAAVAAAVGLVLTGWAAKERSGSAGAVFNIVHGATGAGGTLLAPVTLNANESWSAMLPELACADGISIDFVSGNFDVTLFYKVL